MDGERRLNELLLAWQEQRDRGRDVPAEELCADCPELADALRGRIEVLRRMAAVAGPGEATYRWQTQAAEAPSVTPRLAGRAASGPGGSVARLPGYEILGELGRGGMGVVYKAHHLRLNRVVALKMILTGGDAEAAVRFLREAETVARLAHPNIVQVYDFGSHDGRPWFSLEYVEGGSLAARLRGGPRPAGWAAELVQALAGAIQLAHERGVVHRDLKPANVLLAADGTPKVADFGLAKWGDSAMTATGAILGTPSYMAPEQADSSRDVGPAADVWALGGLLYECLTGQPPFLGATPIETVRMVVETEPVPPSRLSPEVPRDLETVALKCLRKEPARRYPSAAALADDLRRWREGRPITARPLGPLGRARRWCRRNPVVAGLLVAVAVSLLAGIAVSAGYAVKAGRERREAVEARQKEAEARGAAQRQLLDLSVSAGLKAARENDQSLALLWFARAVGLSGNDPEDGRLNRVRGANWLRFVPRPVRAFQLPGFRPQADRLRSLAYHPFGRHLLALTMAGRATLWDLDADREEPLPGGPRPLAAAEFSPEGRLLVLVPPKGPAEVYQFPGLQRQDTLEGPGNNWTAAFSPDGRRLALGGSEGARVWDCRDRAWTTGPIPHPKAVFALGFSPSGTRLATACVDQLGRVFDLSAGSSPAGPVFPPVPHVPEHARCAPVFVNGDKELLTVDDGRELSWRDAATGKVVRDVPRIKTVGIRALRVCPKGQQLAMVWHLLGRFWALGEEPEEVRYGDLPYATDADFDAAGQTVAVAQEDGRVRLWPSDRDSPLVLWHHTLHGGAHEVVYHPTGVIACRFAPVGRGLATVQTDGQVVVWQLPPREPLAYVCTTDGMTRGHASADGSRVLPGGVSYRGGGLRTTRVHDAATGRPLGPPLAPGGLLLDAAFSPDGGSVAVAASSATSAAPRLLPRVRPDNPTGTVQVWDWRSGERRFPPLPTPTEPRGLAYSPDGATLAVACANGVLMIVRASDGSVLHRLDTGQRWGEDANEWYANGQVRFSPDGRVLAFWQTDREVQLWDPLAGRMLHKLPYAERVRDVAFSADSRRLAAASYDNRGRVWDVESGQPAGGAMAHVLGVRSLALDAGRLLTGGGDGRLHLWDPATASPRASWQQHKTAVEAVRVATAGGEWLVTTSQSETLVSEAGRLLPVTPPMLTHNLCFSAETPRGSGRAVVAGFEHALTALDLNQLTAPTDLSAEDLRLLAELCAGHVIDPSAGPVKLKPDEWRERWRAFSRKPTPPAATGGASVGEGSVLIADALAGAPAPAAGTLREAAGVVGAGEGRFVELGGKKSRAVYDLPGVPASEWALSLWVMPLELPGDGPAVVCSAGHRPQDDPLWLVIENGRLWAGVDAGRVYTTGGVPVEAGRWLHIAAVRRGADLSLYVDGVLRGTARTPEAVYSPAARFALGGSPSRAGQGLRGRFAGLRLTDRAMAAGDIERLAGEKPPGS